MVSNACAICLTYCLRSLYSGACKPFSYAREGKCPTTGRRLSEVRQSDSWRRGPLFFILGRTLRRSRLAAFPLPARPAPGRPLHRQRALDRARHAARAARLPLLGTRIGFPENLVADPFRPLPHVAALLRRGEGAGAPGRGDAHGDHLRDALLPRG